MKKISQYTNYLYLLFADAVMTWMRIPAIFMMS